MTRPAKDWRARLERELRAAERLFVLGVGNPDRADDGAGSLCIRLLLRSLARSPFFKCHGEPPAGALPSRSPFSTRSCRPDSRRKTPASGGTEGRADLESGKRKEIRILDAGEVPESSTGLIREFRPMHVLIIDAASAGHTPGTIFFIDKKKIPDDELTTHRIPLSHLVRYLEETIGCRVILLGIEPADTVPCGSISAAVRRSAEILADAIEDAWLRTPDRPVRRRRQPKAI